MTAAIRLGGAMQTNSALILDAKDRVQEFADTGLITQQAADRLKDSIDEAAAAAQRYAGHYVATLDLDATAFEEWVQKVNREQGIRITIGGPGGMGGTPLGLGPGAARGGIMSYARGGMTPAHVATNQLIKYAEPQTGGEAYIPRYGDPSRALGVLQTAAGWFGAQVGPRGGTTHDNRSAVINNYYPTPETSSDSTVRSLRKAQLVLSD